MLLEKFGDADFIVGGSVFLHSQFYPYVRYRDYYKEGIAAWLVLLGQISLLAGSWGSLDRPYGQSLG